MSPRGDLQPAGRVEGDGESEGWHEEGSEPRDWADDGAVEERDRTRAEHSPGPHHQGYVAKQPGGEVYMGAGVLGIKRFLLILLILWLSCSCTFTPKAVKDAKSPNSSKRNAVQNIYCSYRSCDFAFPFKWAALFACTLVVEASAAADAEPQKHKIVIRLVNRKRIISINTCNTE